MPHHEQIREGCQHIHFAAVLEHSAQPGLLKAELLLDHPEWVLTFGADMRFGSFDQIIQAALRRVWQYSALSWPHGNAEADPPSLHLVSLLNPLIARIGIDHGLLAVQEFSGWGQVMHIVSRRFN